MDNDGDENMNEHVFDGCRIEIDEVEWKNIGSLWRRNFILIGLLMAVRRCAKIPKINVIIRIRKAQNGKAGKEMILANPR